VTDGPVRARSSDTTVRPGAIALGSALGWLAAWARRTVPAAVSFLLLERTSGRAFSTNHTWLPRVLLLLGAGFALGSTRWLRTTTPRSSPAPLPGRPSARTRSVECGRWATSATGS